MKYLPCSLLMLCALAHAQSPLQDDVPTDIRLQREALGLERARITQQHEALARDCWQKFAVNDCLAAVRRSQRSQLDPIRQKELRLNAQERDWRTRQREDRLQNKANEAGGPREQ